MKLRLALSLLTTTLFLALACAGARREERAPLAVALAPEAGRLAQDVRWLADDAREGRRAGTSGEEQAARWLAQRLEALGLEPAGTLGFLQAFEVPLPVRDGGGSTLEVHAGDMRIAGEKPELVPLFCSAGSEFEGPLVFAGYGIADADLGRDDYAGLDPNGAVVLIVRGTPPDALLPKSEAETTETPANPHGVAPSSSGGWGGAGAIFYKVMEAKRRGAKAVVVAQHPAQDEPMLAFAAGGGAEAKVPALHVSAALAEQLLPGYAERVKQLDAGAAPSPLGEARTARGRADVVREKGTAHNVLGLVRGREPGRTLVIGAHFDHLGHGGSGSLAPASEQGQIHNGADDNASGTAAVLEIARCLAAGEPPACDVLLALWSGEELGLLGSEHWARSPTIPLERIAANLNLDMVGRAGGGKLSVLGAGSAQPFSLLLTSAGPRAGLDLDVSLSGQGVGGSDHQTFLKREIPALHFFSGLHSDYHRPSDDSERFESEGAARVAALVLDLVDDLAGTKELAFVPPPKEAPGATPGGFKTRFGSIPDYAFDGTGMRLDGTSPGGPAEKAGLLRGDVIVGVGDLKVDGLGDFMHVLNTHKPGDVVLVRFLRDGGEESCQVTLESSQVE
jgi:Zn-dependent M28 family amino/carboxypeptidase